MSIPFTIELPPTFRLPCVVSAAGGFMFALVRRVTSPMRRVAPLHSAPPSVMVALVFRKKSRCARRVTSVVTIPASAVSTIVVLPPMASAVRACVRLTMTSLAPLWATLTAIAEKRLATPVRTSWRAT